MHHGFFEHQNDLKQICIKKHKCKLPLNQLWCMVIIRGGARVLTVEVSVVAAGTGAWAQGGTVQGAAFGGANT